MALQNNLLFTLHFLGTLRYKWFISFLHYILYFILKSQFHNMCMIWIDLNMISRWSELMIKLDETLYNFYSKISVYSKIYVTYILFYTSCMLYFILLKHFIFSKIYYTLFYYYIYLFYFIKYIILHTLLLLTFSPVSFCILCIIICILYFVPYFIKWSSITSSIEYTTNIINFIKLCHCGSSNTIAISYRTVCYVTNTLYILYETT